MFKNKFVQIFLLITETCFDHSFNVYCVKRICFIILLSYMNLEFQFS